MNLSPIFFTILLLTSTTQGLSAQTWKSDLTQYFDSLRSGVRVALPSSAHDFSAANDIVDFVKPYLYDSVEIVRVRSRELLFATASSSTAARAKAVDYLLEATQPIDPLTTGVVLNMIKTFSVHDFSEQAKANVRRLVTAEGSYLSEWMRVSAFLDLKDLIPHIRPYVQPGNRQALRWSALVSLARMEDRSAAEEVLKRVKRLPVNDDLIYNVFPDLLFTRNQSAIDYIIEVLHQDGEHCLSADAEREFQIPCGYRIMEQLAPVIEGFPVAVDDAGDITTSDYAGTLAMVRQWFLSHRDYGINKTRY